MKINSDSFTFSGSPSGFLVVDGVNGAGKTTFLSSICALLEENQKPYALTREPGPKTPLGQAARKLLMESGTSPLDPLAELFLFAADRAEHVTKIIQPGLHAGRIVLSDRYYYSTFAFQGHGRGLDLSLVEQVNETAIQGCRPDLVFLLDLDPLIGLQRTSTRENNGEEDSFEKEDHDFQKRIREGFLAVAQKCSEPVCVLDASQDIEKVFSTAKPLLERWLAAM